MSTSPTLVSLFSGAGGLDIGLERAGWNTVFATDIDPSAVRTLRASKDAQIPIPGRGGRAYLDEARIVEADICDLRASDIRPRGAKATWRPSLLAGGPPCQPWSSAGLQLGFEDARGLLIGQMLRLASELHPRYVLTAVGPRGKHGEAIQMIDSEWNNLGYAVRWALLNAADYGAAQRRVRLVMIATSDHELPEFPEPTHDEHGACGLEPWVTLGHLLSQCRPPAPSEVVVPSGAREGDLLALVPGTGIKTGGTIEHQRPGGHWGYRQDSFLADLSVPSRTIRAAGTPDWIRLDGVMRRLAWRECAALQGFPREWAFDGQRDSSFRLIGNAVQTDMAMAIGNAIKDSLERGTARMLPQSPEWPEYFKRRIRGAAADHRANAASRIRHRRLQKAS
jgi:DNA (cytosine-5)-methyltransferase 1